MIIYRDICLAICLLSLSFAGSTALFASEPDHTANPPKEQTTTASPTQLIGYLETTLSLRVIDPDNAREFELHLKPNTRLNNLLAESSYPPITFYSGSALNQSDSWVRLTLIDQTFSGMMYAAGEWYDISTENNKVVLENSSEQFRQWNQTDSNARSLDPIIFAPNVSQHLNNHSRNDVRMDVDDGLPRAIKIGVVVDSLFNDYHNGNGLNRALTIINNVDGMYQSAFGLSLVVETIKLYQDPDTDPLRLIPNDIDLIINSYRNTRSNDPELRADLGLVHVFTGHSNPEQAVGVGWIGTLCRLDGFDMSLSTPFTFDTLLAAHEIAHNLGALHDEDQACLGLQTPGSNLIMSQQISNQTQAVFSQCSLSSIEPARRASCLFNDIDLRLDAHALSTNRPNTKILSVQIQNPDSSRSATDVISRTVFPPNTLLEDQSAGCSIEFSTLVCVHGRIDAGSSSVISVVANFSNTQSDVVQSSIELTTVADSNTSNNIATVSVPPLDDATAENSSSGGSAGGGTMYTLVLLLGLFQLRQRNFNVTST
ncbi:MAG: hypothetical protein KTR35_19985 [Gammaproteobacteria bacterium]|nr:hypothetical protein [Gammaproteobacteria bacterium]